MGQRANYVIIDDDGWELYYSHWGANVVHYDFFWGVAHACSFVRSQSRVGRDDWLDDVWCEGGALVDTVAQVLLLFGGEDLPYDVPLKRVYFQALAKLWPGWQLRWAFEGLADFADYLGIDRSCVRSGRTPTAVDVFALNDDEWCRTLVTLCDQNGRVHSLRALAALDEVLVAGPCLAERLRHTSAGVRLSLDELPASGIHIDVTDRRVSYWTGGDHPDLISVAREAWPDWELRFGHDRYESQLEACHGEIVVRVSPVTALVEQVRAMLSVDHGDPVARFERTLDHLRDEGSDVEVNRATSLHQTVPVPIEVRGGVLDAVLAEIASEAARQAH